MATKKSLWVLLNILFIVGLVLGSTIQAEAQEQKTMKYKFYTWVVKAETVPVDDVEGHNVALQVRGSFVVYENGEVATARAVVSSDRMKLSSQFMQYSTTTFEDGSTISSKTQGTREGGVGGWTTEIIKGTGRFEGIKGTVTTKAKYLPLEKGEAGTKGYGEGTMTYTVPSKGFLK